MIIHRDSRIYRYKFQIHSSGPFNGPRSTGATDLKGCRQKLKVPGPKNPTPGMNSQSEITLSWFVVFPQILDYSFSRAPFGSAKRCLTDLVRIPREK